MATVDAGFDNCDETNPKWLADNLQGLYQVMCSPGKRRGMGRVRACRIGGGM